MVSSKDSLQDAISIARGRSLLYLWLSGLFLEKPSEEVFKKFAQKEVLEFLDGVFQDSKDYLKVKEFLVSGDIEDVRREYEKLFVNKEVSPYSRDYLGEEQADFVEKFYRSLGLDVELMELEAEDHIGLELAVMASLCELEAEELEEGRLEEAALVLGSEKVFLEEHMRKWVGDFAKKVDEKAAEGFYSSLAWLTNEMLELDYSLFMEGSQSSESQ